MRKKRSISTILANTAIFIILEVAALHILTHHNAAQNFFITRGLQGLSGKLWGISESISDYSALRKKNNELAQDVFRLNSEAIRLRGELNSSRTDTLAQHMNDAGKFDFISATVIKNSTNKQHNYVIIDKGSKDGVTPQSGVITANGVVGIVDAVSRNYSCALSFLNSKLSISARIGNEGAAGPMEWDGHSSDGAILREVPLQYKFEQGDTVYTSGFSSIFPADIPLGTVGESDIVNGSTYEIRVRLFQDFSTLRYVTVVNNRDLKEIEELEKEVLQ